MVRTLPFQGENTGSIPVGTTQRNPFGKTEGFCFMLAKNKSLPASAYQFANVSQTVKLTQR